VAAVLLTCGPAAATTVTYNFDEAGWTNNFGTIENFSGTFAGSVEASGVVALADLTAFTATVTETNAQGDSKPIGTFGLPFDGTGLNTFLFDTLTNTLSIGATGSPGATVCLGDAVVQGACGPLAAPPLSRTGVPAPPPEGLFLSTVNGALNGFTFAAPSIALEQTTLNPGIGIAPTPAPAPTPEPASMVLCGSALVLISLGLRNWRGDR
jgi:hypothetical protein